MKSRILTLAALSIMLFSCGTKKASSEVADKSSTDTKVVVDATAGQSLYENNCAKCHDLYAPKSHTQEEWVPILKRMQKKAHLDDGQMANIAAYIDSQL